MRKLELLPILLLAISSNGDNVAVGVAYGLGRIAVPLSSNLLIAVSPVFAPWSSCMPARESAA